MTGGTASLPFMAGNGPHLVGVAPLRPRIRISGSWYAWVGVSARGIWYLAVYPAPRTASAAENGGRTAGFGGASSNFSLYRVIIAL